MIKKNVLFEAKLQKMIDEAIMNYLFEAAASIVDIYQKYYQDINSDDFENIYKSDPTFNPQKPNKIGKYTKWLLNLYRQGKLKTEDLYKANEYLKYFNKYINKIEQKDINKYNSLPNLYTVVEPFITAEQNNQTVATSKSDEARIAKKDVKKIYEDSNWLILIPLTQEAAIYYGKNTQWCTAATSSNNMFNHYNSEGPLFINIDKRNNRKYQFHFESDQFMDERDDEISLPIAETIGMSRQVVINAYPNHYKILMEKKISLIPLNNKVYIRNGCQVVRFEHGDMFDDELGDEEYVIGELPRTVYNDTITQVATNLFACTYNQKLLLIDTLNYQIREAEGSFENMMSHKRSNGQIIVVSNYNHNLVAGMFNENGEFNVLYYFRTTGYPDYLSPNQGEDNVSKPLSRYMCIPSGREEYSSNRIYNVYDLEKMKIILNNVVFDTETNDNNEGIIRSDDNSQSYWYIELRDAISDYDIDQYLNHPEDEDEDEYGWDDEAYYEDAVMEALHNVNHYAAFEDSGQIWLMDYHKKPIKQIS